MLVVKARQIPDTKPAVKAAAPSTHPGGEGGATHCGSHSHLSQEASYILPEGPGASLRLGPAQSFLARGREPQQNFVEDNSSIY